MPRKGRGSSRKSPLPFSCWPAARCPLPLGSAMSPVRAVLALLAALAAPAAAYFVSIDAHAEECFLERVPSGTKMGLIFEVAEGGFLDIDVEVRGDGVAGGCPTSGRECCAGLREGCRALSRRRGAARGPGPALVPRRLGRAPGSSGRAAVACGGEGGEHRLEGALNRP